MNDEGFIKDRDGFFGPDWKVGDVATRRTEGIVHMRLVFQTIEDLLGDGRQWLADTEQVSIADFEGKHTKFSAAANLTHCSCVADGLGRLNSVSTRRALRRQYLPKDLRLDRSLPPSSRCRSCSRR